MTKFFLTLMALALVATGVQATNPVDPSSPAGVAVVKNGSTFKLIYKSETSGNVKVKIFNKDSHVVFSETLSNVDNFMRPYNFSSLPYGDYTIELADANGKKVEKIGYYRGAVERFVKVIRLNGETGKYLLTIASKANESLRVRILDAKNQLLYSQSEKINGDFAKVYNLKKVSGEIQFEITDDNGVVKTITY